VGDDAGVTAIAIEVIKVLCYDGYSTVWLCVDNIVRIIERIERYKAVHMYIQG